MILFFLFFFLFVTIALFFLFFLFKVLPVYSTKFSKFNSTILYSGYERDYLAEDTSTQENITHKAIVLCNSARAVSTRFTFTGLGDCRMLKNTYENSNNCQWGCLGFGTCATVCPQEAIKIENGTAVILESCNGCGKCIPLCPNNLIKLIPVTADYIIPCAAHGGSDMDSICSTACTGCKICQDSFENKGFKVKNNLASIDYSKKADREAAAQSCPSHCIVKYEQKEKKHFKFWQLCYTMLFRNTKNGK